MEIPTCSLGTMPKPPAGKLDKKILDRFHYANKNKRDARDTRDKGDGGKKRGKPKQQPKPKIPESPNFVTGKNHAAAFDSLSKKEEYYSYIENLSREVSQLNGVIQEENDSIRTMRQALRKLEKSYNDKSKELFETINIGIDNWTPPPIQTEFAEVGECADTPENVGAKNLSPEIDGKTASTESAAEAERDIEWNINKEHAIIKKVDKFSNAIFIHKLPNGEIDFQDMRMPGIVGAYAFANDKWKEKYISDFDVFKEMNSQKDFGMPELFTENDVKVKIGALYDVFCYLFTEDVIETLSKKP